MRYSFDSSSFINGRRDLLPPTILPTLWDRISEQVAAGAIRAAEPVRADAVPYKNQRGRSGSEKNQRGLGGVPGLRSAAAAAPSYKNQRGWARDPRFGRIHGAHASPAGSLKTFPGKRWKPCGTERKMPRARL